MSFDNQTIKAPCRTKPHICIRDGYWRVSPLDWKRLVVRQARYESREFWEKAHTFSRDRNGRG